MERKCGATDTCQRRPRPAFHLRYGDRKTSDPPSGSNRLPFGSTVSDRPFTPLAALCRRFTGFYRVSLCFFFVVRDFTGFHRVSLGFTGFYWVLLGYLDVYWAKLARTKAAASTSAFGRVWRGQGRPRVGSFGARPSTARNE